MINKRRTIKAQKKTQTHYEEGFGGLGLLEYEEYEDKEGLSRVQSNLQINLEIFSDPRTATPCGPNLETLTMSNKESLNNKVIDLFELYKLDSEFALFGLWMRELWSKYYLG